MDKDDLMRKEFEESKNPVWGCNTINPKYCRSCKFSKGDPPFADLPLKAHCIIYSRGSGTSKPDAVYYDGKRCDFYEMDDK